MTFTSVVVDQLSLVMTGGMKMDHVQFRRSSYCGSNACVEVGYAGDDVYVRDSKQTNGPVLRFTAHEWQSFLTAIKADEWEM